MPLISKTDLFSTVIDQVKKGLGNQPGNQNPSQSRQYPSSSSGYSQSSSTSYSGHQSNMSYPGGYPNQGGYPGQPGGYPGQPGGYPGSTSGYPNQPSGYPSQPTGYPSQPCPNQPGFQPGYPSQPGFPNQPSGYPSQPSGYPSQPSGYPSQPSGYPSQPSGYPSQPSGYPSQPSGHPSQPSGHPSQPSGYPSQPTGYSVQPGYPSQPSGYSGQGQPGHPGGYQQPGGYPPQGNAGQYGGGYSQPGYNPAGGFGGGVQSTGMLGTPTIRPYGGFNANADAETLRKAMKGFGCDKNKVVAVLCARSNAQRQQIAQAFKTMYGKDIRKELESELTGDFEDLILGLMDAPAVYDAYHLKKAIAGIGTKESVLIEIMCSRTNAQIAEIKRVYRQMYKKDLERDIIGDTSGYFQRLLVSMSAAGRDESMRTDQLKANQDARNLYRAGEQRLGTDEAAFNSILAAQNYAQLRLVFQEYQKITSHSIERAIESEFSGDIKDGLLAIVSCVQNKAAYFSKLLYNSMAGMGTRDTDLIRIIVSRSEVDLADIRNEFPRLYKKSLVDMIKGDCSGAYKDGLIAIVNGN